ncbi:hypothetical protein YN1_7280 [Nanoarchaeota archaeon]
MVFPLTIPDEILKKIEDTVPHRIIEYLKKLLEKILEKEKQPEIKNIKVNHYIVNKGTININIDKINIVKKYIILNNRNSNIKRDRRSRDNIIIYHNYNSLCQNSNYSQASAVTIPLKVY